MDATNSVLFATLTLAHERAVSIKDDEDKAEAVAHMAECDSLISATWAAFSESYKKDLEPLGWVSQFRRNEWTVGPGFPVQMTTAGIAAAANSKLLSYHHHIHVLVFTTGKHHKLERLRDEPYEKYSNRQAEANLELSKLLHAAWQKSLAAALRKAPGSYPRAEARLANNEMLIREPKVETKVKRLTGGDGVIREKTFSLVKGGATIETLYGEDQNVEDYILGEVTSGFTKQTKTESTFSFRQALETFGSSAPWLNLSFAHWVSNRKNVSEQEFGRVHLDLGRGKTKFVGFDTFRAAVRILTETGHLG